VDNFIVGGFLPGTNIQLSFQAWLTACLIILIIGLFLWRSHQRHIVRMRKRASQEMDMISIAFQPVVTTTVHKASALQLNIGSAYSHFLEQALEVLKNIVPSERHFRR
jgi:predicted negative regulator of RcsB-dependent stress response